MKKYQQKDEKVDKWAPPTPFEKSRKGKFSLTKVIEKNKNQKIRAVGCFIGVTETEYQNGKTIPEIYLPLKYYDYIVFMRDSEYRENTENMFI
jgi:hypothetical protein